VVDRPCRPAAPLTSFVDGADEDGPAGAFVRAGIADRSLRRVEHTEAGTLGVLRLGFRCNQRCAMCFQGRSWPDPPAELVRTWLDELGAAGVDMLMLTGGEPTVFPELPELIERASQRYGMEVHLQTNGVMLADAEYLAMLVEAGLAVVSVAFHSADPAASDELTGSAGGHERTVRGIENALGANLLVLLVACVEDATVGGLEQYAEFVVRELVRPFSDNSVARVEFLQPGGYYDEERMARTMTPLDRVAAPMVAAARLLRDAEVDLEIGGACGFPQCVFHEAPDLVPWRHRGEPDRRGVYWRDYDDTCGRCAAAGYCLGLREEYRRIHGAAGVLPYDALPQAAAAADRSIERLRRRADALRARRQGRRPLR
jgi:MoaA/NifB/PqqE/SkfB family radical SAM enzyme